MLHITVIANEKEGEKKEKKKGWSEETQGKKGVWGPVKGSKERK